MIERTYTWRFSFEEGTNYQKNGSATNFFTFKQLTTYMHMNII